MRKTVILFGASKRGMVAHLYYKDIHDIIAFVDNDEKKWGQKLCGLEILPPERIKDFPDAHVIITSIYKGPILRQLSELRELSNTYIFRVEMAPFNPHSIVHVDIFTDPKYPDDIFHKIPQNREEMVHREGFYIDFLNVATNIKYVSECREGINFSYPSTMKNLEDYLETRCLVDAVLNAGNVFKMIELGAGFGKWSVRGAAIARKLGKQFLLTAVEGDTTHFEWLKQNFADNGIDASRHHLLHAAVCGYDGEIDFWEGEEDPSSWYGQSILRGEREGKVVKLRAISLNTLLADYDYVDLLDMDIQGAEYEVLSACNKETLNAKVKRIYIGTHGNEIERELRTLFSSLDWEKVYDFQYGNLYSTENGMIYFGDGVQLWVNPHIH